MHKKKIIGYRALSIVIVWFLVLTGSLLVQAQEPELSLAGDWEVELQTGTGTERFGIDQADYLNVADEKHASLPVFNPNGPSWRKGLPLNGVKAEECCVFDALVPDTLVLRLAPGVGEPLVEGTDYLLDLRSGNIGRLEGGAIGAETPVYASYRSVMMRIDSIVHKRNGQFTVVRGVPHQSTPRIPVLMSSEKRLGNVYIPGRIEKLEDDMLFPIESKWADHQFETLSPSWTTPAAEKLLPKTWEKLHNGEDIRIMAWGDSVTDAGYLPQEERWQHQFVAKLQRNFPKAKITLITQAWGGRNTDSYRNEPPGSPKNYQEQVLDVKPDLIISEFVNDAGMSEEMVNEKYGAILADFRNIGAEWIICTPHYVRPDWMGLTGQKNIDDDPRPYVIALRKFAPANNVPLADAALFYGQLWRKGIPYLTLMENNINHPEGYGMSLFADALINLFQ